MPTLVLLLVLSNFPLFLLSNLPNGRGEAASKDACKLSIWPADREN